MVQNIQLVQNAVARLLSGVSYRDCFTPVLKDVYWLLICFWAQKQITDSLDLRR